MKTETKKERMDPFTSVFNSHVNDAKDRADKEFIAQYGQELFNKEIEPFTIDGVMAIFSSPPTISTASWVALVTAYVNEGRNA